MFVDKLFAPAGTTNFIAPILAIDKDFYLENFAFGTEGDDVVDEFVLAPDAIEDEYAEDIFFVFVLVGDGVPDARIDDLVSAGALEGGGVGGGVALGFPLEMAGLGEADFLGLGVGKIGLGPCGGCREQEGGEEKDAGGGFHLLRAEGRPQKRAPLFAT